MSAPEVLTADEREELHGHVVDCNTADLIATVERILAARAPAPAVDERLTHAEKELLRPVLARYAQWESAHDGPVFEAFEQIMQARHADITAAAPAVEADLRARIEALLEVEDRTLPPYGFNIRSTDLRAALRAGVVAEPVE